METQIVVKNGLKYEKRKFSDGDRHFYIGPRSALEQKAREMAAGGMMSRDICRVLHISNNKYSQLGLPFKYRKGKIKTVKTPPTTKFVSEEKTESALVWVQISKKELKRVLLETLL